MSKLFTAAQKLAIRQQRQEDRLHREFPTELKLISLPGGEKPGSKTIKCVATNISLSGTRIALATHTALEVGTVARIKIKCGLLKSFTFTGTGVSWIGQKDSNFGQASVYLDNVLVATVSTYNATNVYQQTLYSVSNLTAGSHTLKIVPTGTHAAPSTDNWMEIDAFTYTSSARNAKRDIASSVCFVGFEITDSSPRTLEAWRAFIASYFRAGKSRR
jgi:hypothetical protein